MNREILIQALNSREIQPDEGNRCEVRFNKVRQIQDSVTALAETFRSKDSTCDRRSTAGPLPATLLPQGRNFSFQHLQSAHELLEAGQVVAAAAGLPGYVDAVREDDLVVPVDRVLCDLVSVHPAFSLEALTL